MNLTSIFAAAALALACGSAQAELNGTRGGNTGMGAGAAAGALIGGPPGAIVGAGLGAFFGDRVARSIEADSLETDLASARGETADLQQALAVAVAELDDRDAAIAEFERRQAMARQLEVEVLFRTDSSHVDPLFSRRLERLAALLRAHPSLGIRLDGHADARGAGEHNEALSAARTGAVRDALLAHGVAGDRIAAFNHGDRSARAPADDVDALAMDRRVVIKLEATRSPSRVASRAPGRSGTSLNH